MDVDYCKTLKSLSNDFISDITMMIINKHLIQKIKETNRKQMERWYL